MRAEEEGFNLVSEANEIAEETITATESKTLTPDNSPMNLSANKTYKVTLTYGNHAYNYDVTTGATDVQIKYFTTDGALGITGDNVKVKPSSDNEKNNIRFDGYTRQGIEGDCMLFAYINSLGRCSNMYDLSDIIEITENTNGYYVKFKKYNFTGKENTAYITKADLNKYAGLYGDITSRLLDMGVRSLVVQNEGYNLSANDNSLETLSVRYFSRYLLGIDKGTELVAMLNHDGKNNRINLNHFRTICEMCMNGELEALIVSFESSKLDYENGIMGPHAYTIKDIDFSHNDNNLDWITFVNFWDVSDCLRLTVSDFLYGKSTWRDINILGKNLTDFIINWEDNTISLK